jgi:hypothetical protein
VLAAGAGAALYATQPEPVRQFRVVVHTDELPPN